LAHPIALHTQVGHFLLQESVSTVFREGQSVFALSASKCFAQERPCCLPGAVSLEPQSHEQGAWWGAEQGRPWAGPLLLSWAGLLGPRGAPGKRAALQRDSSAQEQLLCTAQQGWGHCLRLALGGERREIEVTGYVN